MSDLTFPQVGDLPDASFISALIGAQRSGIVSGLTLNPDFSVPEVAVQPGFAVIETGSETTQHPNISPAETVQETSKVVDLDAQTEPLTNNAVNSIFLDANIGTDDDPQVVANTTGTNPTPASFKIGEIDTSANTTAEQFNRIEQDGTRSFPTRAAASDALTGLPDGVSVIDRATGVRLTANGELSAQNITAKGALTSSQSIPNNTVTQLEIDTAAIEQDSAVIDVAVANDELIINEAGVFELTATVRFIQTVTDGFELTIRRRGNAAVAQHTENLNGSLAKATTVSTVIKVATGAGPVAISAEVFHGSSGSRSLGQIGTALTVTRQS